MNEQRSANLAGYLAVHLRNATRIRSINLALVPVFPTILHELEHYKAWTFNEYNTEFKVLHGLALHEVISQNAKEIKELVAKARETPNAQDVRPLLDKAKQLQERVVIAHDFLEKLNG